ncbi:MAG: hypothetical protein HC853_10145 [Anaerolineae bacterium]|nr:hypothetical protein [Anaerolineae bacterium]
MAGTTTAPPAAAPFATMCLRLSPRRSRQVRAMLCQQPSYAVRCATQTRLLTNAEPNNLLCRVSS